VVAAAEGAYRSLGALAEVEEERSSPRRRTGAAASGEEASDTWIDDKASQRAHEALGFETWTGA
jgi:hypothetical protein